MKLSGGPGTDNMPCFLILRIPKLERVGDGEEAEIEVVDDPSAYEVLAMDRIPLVVTLTLVSAWVRLC